jgi:hypothetical protein
MTCPCDEKRTYIAGAPGNPDWETAAVALTAAGYHVVPKVKHSSMRLELATALTCDYLCLLDDWWTDVSATAVQTVAAWLKMPILDATTGQPMETLSLSGVRRGK